MKTILASPQPVPFDVKEAKNIVSLCTCTAQAVADIHKLVLAQAGIDYDSVDQLQSYVQCHEQDWKEVCRAMQAKEEELNRLRPYDKQVLPGGAWLNWGFSASPKAPRGSVLLPEITLK